MPECIAYGVALCWQKNLLETMLPKNRYILVSTMAHSMKWYSCGDLVENGLF